MTDLKVVGEIKPPDFKDPVKLLRKIADDIEAGVYGEVNTAVVALAGDKGFDTFGAGRKSSIEHCAFLFGYSATRLHALPWSRYIGPAT